VDSARDQRAPLESELEALLGWASRETPPYSTKRLRSEAVCHCYGKADWVSRAINA
jgi:hypothetical protein